MRRLFMLLSFVSLISCHKDNPVSTDKSFSLPEVSVSGSNYTEALITARVPDSTLMATCRSAYAGRLTDSMKSVVRSTFLEKAGSLGQDTSTAAACLMATGQLEVGAVSVLYLAEKADYASRPCWIFEFAWGMDAADLGHYRCFVMDVATRDTLLYLTCR